MQECEIVLDVTRLLTRAHLRVPRGIDRVELTYAQRVLRGSPPFDRFLHRSFVASVEGEVHTVPYSCVAFVAAALSRRWTHGSHMGPRQARWLRRLLLSLVARCPPPRFERSTVYFDVGHKGTLGLQEHATKAREWHAVVLVHDAMPITHEEFFSAEMREKFGTWLRAIVTSDVLLATSRTAMREIESACERFDARPRLHCAPLGIDQKPMPHPPPPRAPYFVALGAIEPRKNVDLLLATWTKFDRPPTLYLVGAVDSALRNRTLPPGVVVRSDVADEELSVLLRGARALLFPSLAEGYGLPLLEALAAGVPVIASDLPVFRELGSNIPELLPPQDVASWRDAVLSYLRDDGARRAQLDRMLGWSAPSWEDHFRAVGAALDGMMTRSSKQTR